MASSSFFNLDNGTTRAPSCSSSDMQPEIGSVPFQKPSQPFTYPAVLSPSAEPSRGIFVPLTPLMQISPSNPYAQREFSLELYERVSAHVVHMQEHPYEKTLEYRVSRVRIVCRGYLARFKARVSRRVRVFLASARRYIGRRAGSFAAFLEAVAYRCRVALQRVSPGCLGRLLFQ
ncbi:hypothetical protein Agabi119p4_6866 [Agaricus bisporus var. burnettii]|uniref:Uncharacterized protein n=1 Tax=Agaricus bisporus var. burnettii TaxID=192524 RepID=A0A8H7F0D3_AGABI|nr:hypothetical protein Agabi119p4_6866 [Agaricus bisporus var. burnettii]